MSETRGDTLFDWLGREPGIEAHKAALDEAILAILERETDR